MSDEIVRNPVTGEPIVILDAPPDPFARPAARRLPGFTLPPTHPLAGREAW